MIKILKKSKISRARTGLIKTPHGIIKTPAFMPDATRGVIKNLSARELDGLSLNCLVSNTLHLFLRPGLRLIKMAGGLHKFMNWPKPILTDSGGYQIFSLIHKSKNNGLIADRGAIFKSPLHGANLELTPEQSIKIQFGLGADIIVCLDDCPPNDCGEAGLKAAVDRTISWAARCKKAYNGQIKKTPAPKNKKPLLIAVIQGGNNLDLRKFCSAELLKIGFDGFGFGARHIDESGNFLSKALEHTAELIPENKIRFGLGIGSPEDIFRSVKMGWDLFDCVIPTREGRHGRLFFAEKNFSRLKKPSANCPKFYQTANITNNKFSKDFSPINPDSRLIELKTYSKAYLHHLFKIKEPLGARLASLNNLEFYLKMLEEIRSSINKNIF